MLEYDEPLERSADERSVTMWRLEQLLAAGYDHDSAVSVAHARHVDLHEAVDLVRLTRCSPALAARILV